MRFRDTLAHNAARIGEVPSGSSASVREFCQSADVLKVAAERRRFDTSADEIRAAMCKRRSKAETFAHRKKYLRRAGYFVGNFKGKSL